MRSQIKTCFYTILFVSGLSTSAMALSPAPELKLKNTLGDVTTYELTGKDIEVNSMASEFKYEDLTQKEMKDLQSLVKAKQEYGKMFGFADWKATAQKLVEKDGERIVLIQGNYKNAEKKTVNFIEVYWANKEKSGQYLITSDSIALKVDQYSDYLK